MSQTDLEGDMNYNYVFFGVLGTASLLTLNNIFFKVLYLFSSDEQAKKAIELKLVFFLIVFQLVILGLGYFVYKKGPGTVRKVLLTMLEFIIANKKWFIFAVVASFLGFITMGLPGFGVLSLDEKMTGLLNGLFSDMNLKSFRDKYHGDSVWPAAIMISILWPWGVLLLNKVYEKLFQFSTGVCSIILSALSVLILILFAL